MGLLEGPSLGPFTKKHIFDKELVLKMLSYEDAYIFSPEGQDLYSSFGFQRFTSSEPEFSTARRTLSHFGFDTDDESLSNYRHINANWYKGPHPGQHDPDIMAAVVYLRANKCLRYTLPKPCRGEVIPNPVVFSYDFETMSLETKPLVLHSVLDQPRNLVGAFSGS